jgi:hypothetical protein
MARRGLRMLLSTSSSLMGSNWMGRECKMLGQSCSF